MRKPGSKWKSDEFSAKTSLGRGGGGSGVKSEKRREISCEFVADGPKTEENSHEVAPTVLAHTSPTVVSAAVTALLKITVGHLVVLYPFAILGEKNRQNSH